MNPTHAQLAKFYHTIVFISCILSLSNFAFSRTLSVQDKIHLAESGDAASQFVLGEMYRNGQGVPQSYRQAFYWSDKSASQGFAPAQVRMGSIYESGDGVPQDSRKAVLWYRRAAEQGEPLGQCALGWCYKMGDGVPKDDVEAYKWLNLAVAGGDERAAQLRSRLEQSMSRTEIILAQERSRAFTPHHENQNKKDFNRGQQTPPSTASKPTPKSSGSGFFVTDDGFILTNHHVVEGAARVMVLTKAGLIPAKLVQCDAVNDLALLKVNGGFKGMPVVASRDVKLGATVFTLGFPDIQLQGLQPKLTKGEISSLAGSRDDLRYFQISVAVQPGNSGGPLVNEFGNVAGIVTARLSDKAALQASGALPQNVNYAVKSSYIEVFLESIPEIVGKLKEPYATNERKFDAVVSEAVESAVLIIVY